MSTQTPAILALIVLSAGTLACAPEAELQDRLDFDSARSLEQLGQDGPQGVGLLERSFRIHVDQSVDTDIFLPLDEQGAPIAGPLVIMTPGGLVERQRYRWLGDHIASRGFVVLSADHLLDLAFFSQGNGLDAAAALRQASHSEDDPLFGLLREEIPAMAIGHSLGGVISAKQWLEDPEQISHLVLLASEPDPADEFEERPPEGLVLSLIGDRDGLQSVEDSLKGIERMRNAQPRKIFAVLEGVNHFQFTDEPTEGNLADDKDSPLEIDQARRRANYLLDAALADMLGQRQARALEQPASWPEGILTRSQYEGR